jgi:regulatory protein
VVLLSNGQKCTVGVEALAAAAATRVGAVLDAPRLAQLLHAASVTGLVDRALNTLARGRRTRRELEMRLRRVEPNAALVAEALDRLEASGVLSDTEVAHAEAAARLRRGDAPQRIRQRLRRKGVDARGTDLAIADAIERDGFDELAACRVQATRRWKGLAALDRTVARRRLMAFLQRRGFSGSVVRTVVTDLMRG